MIRRLRNYIDTIDRFDRDKSMIPVDIIPYPHRNVGSQVMEQRDALIDPKFNETLNPLLRSNEQLTPTNKH